MKFCKSLGFALVEACVLRMLLFLDISITWWRTAAWKICNLRDFKN